MNTDDQQISPRHSPYAAEVRTRLLIPPLPLGMDYLISRGGGGDLDSKKYVVFTIFDVDFTTFYGKIYL